MTITLPEKQFDKLAKTYAAMKIFERKPVELTLIRGKKICITSGCYAGGKYEWITGWEAVPLEKYQGALEPLGYWEHSNEVDTGKRKRGYDGMKITSAGAWWVLTGKEITFKPIEAGNQLSIF